MQTPFNERNCTLCLELQEEFHFLLDCPLYKDLRKKELNILLEHHKYAKLYRTITSENETVITCFINVY